MTSTLKFCSSQASCETSKKSNTQQYQSPSVANPGGQRSQELSIIQIRYSSTDSNGQNQNMFNNQASGMNQSPDAFCNQGVNGCCNPGYGMGTNQVMNTYQNPFMSSGSFPQFINQCMTLINSMVNLISSIMPQLFNNLQNSNTGSFNPGNYGNRPFGNLNNNGLNNNGYNRGIPNYNNSPFNNGRSGGGIPYNNNGYGNGLVNTGTNAGLGNNGTTRSGNTGISGYKTNAGITGPGVVQNQVNFEDGTVPNAPLKTKEPTRIMTDANGNKYLRFTSNYGDQEGVPTQYRDRVRDTMYMTKPHWEMPELNDQNKHMSYSADVRFIDNKSTQGYYNNSFFELFQGSNTHKSTGYAAYDSAGGPPAKLVRRDDGHVCFQITQEVGPGQPQAVKQYDLGYYGANEFHNFNIDAVWSQNPNEGGYKVMVDGQEKLNLQGINTYYNPRKSNLLPAMKVGLYGGNAVGTVDVDNVEVKNLS